MNYIALIHKEKNSDRINITLPEDVLGIVDQRARRLNTLLRMLVSKSGFQVYLACANHLEEEFLEKIAVADQRNYKQERSYFSND